MIITALKGGLGNQLFQYALGAKLARLNGETVSLDITGLDRANVIGDIYRPYALGEFSHCAVIASNADIVRIKYPYGVASKISRRIRFKLLRQMHIGWEPKILRKHGDRYLDGYWQSFKYFDDIREELLNDLTLKSVSVTAQDFFDRVRATKAVSVHIRRGDYVASASANAVHGTCSPSYYVEAMQYITDRIADPAWFVFSDDPAWVRENIPFTSEPVFVSGTGVTDAEEISLMSACAHNIIANSTFSWWGAWLNQNPEKIVIAPKPWVNNSPMVYADLIPASWISLPKN